MNHPFLCVKRIRESDSCCRARHDTCHSFLLTVIRKGNSSTTAITIQKLPNM
jgi:hypothetical protein